MAAMNNHKHAPARLALTRREAAEAIGCSVDYLRDHVEGDLRVIRKGRRILIPVGELTKWLDLNAARTLEVSR